MSGPDAAGLIAAYTAPFRNGDDPPVMNVVWSGPSNAVYLTPDQAEAAARALTMLAGKARLEQAALDAQPETAALAMAVVEGRA